MKAFTADVFSVGETADVYFSAPGGRLRQLAAGAPGRCLLLKHAVSAAAGRPGGAACDWSAIAGGSSGAPGARRPSVVNGLFLNSSYVLRALIPTFYTSYV